MTFISYAQNFEDVMLWRALKDIEHGFYIDVGANDPEIDSVTKAFYDHGWRGINIEPVEQWFKRLETERPRDINLQLAAGARNGELTLYELPDTGLSTSDKTTAERHKTEHGFEAIERKVGMETLTSICQRLHVAPIHFLKVDAEGAEKDVLTGLDLTSIRPWIIVVESTLPMTQVERHKRWESILLNAEYEHAYFDGLNRYYVANEHQHLKTHFRAPPNVFDGFTLNSSAQLVKKTDEAVQRAQAAETRATHAEARTAQAEAETEQARADMAQAQAATEQAEARAAHAEARTAQAEAETEQARADMAQAQADAEQARTQTHALEQQIQAQQARIDELGVSSHHWWLTACARENHIQALLQSTSWRITRPLRWVGSVARSMTPSGIKPRVKLLLQHAALYVGRRPRLKRLVLAVLQHFPSLAERLKRIRPAASAIPQATQPSVSTVSTESTELIHMSARARQIYAVIERHRRGNN